MKYHWNNPINADHKSKMKIKFWEFAKNVACPVFFSFSSKLGSCLFKAREHVS